MLPKLAWGAIFFCKIWSGGPLFARAIFCMTVQQDSRMRVIFNSKFPPKVQILVAFLDNQLENPCTGVFQLDVQKIYACAEFSIQNSHQKCTHARILVAFFGQPTLTPNRTIYCYFNCYRSLKIGGSARIGMQAAWGALGGTPHAGRPKDQRIPGLSLLS